MRFALGLLAALVLAPALAAQPSGRLYNQQKVGELLYAQRDTLGAIPDVRWFPYVIDHPTKNSILARTELYRAAGEGDPVRGKDRLAMVQFMNRVWLDDLRIGDTLALPTHLDQDPRAYAPFPRDYAGARDFDKLFIIHKGAQAWAAYESGRLERWGLVNTGAVDSQTPAGRYNFNWRERERVSTLSPPGETWRMRWVVNFHDARGIHVHQYAMPIGEPASHGCVRTITRDAEWIYEWADLWRTTNGHGSRGLASRGRILQQGTTVLVLGEEPVGGPPQRFRWDDGVPTLVVVDLPDDPYSVPAGTPQQERFDRIRKRNASS